MVNFPARHFLSVAATIGAESLSGRALLIAQQAVLLTVGIHMVALEGAIASLQYSVLGVLATMGSAGAVLVARDRGGDGRREARGSVWAMISIVGLAAGMVSLAVGINPHWISSNFIDDAASNSEGALAFVRLVFLAFPFLVMSAVLAAVLRTDGVARFPLGAALANGVFVLVCLVTIARLDLSADSQVRLIGGTYALAAMLTWLAYMAMVLRRYGTPAVLRGKGRLREQAGRLLALALPMTYAKLIWSLFLVFQVYLLSSGGVGTQAAGQIAFAVQNFGISALSGLPYAALNILGGIVANSSPAQVRRVTSKMNILVYCLALAVGLLAAGALPFVASFYAQDCAGSFNSELALALVLTSILIPIVGINMYFSGGVLVAGGVSAFLVRISTTSLLAVGLPVTMVMAFYYQSPIAAVFGGKIAEELFRLCLLILHFHRGEWLETSKTSGA